MPKLLTHVLLLRPQSGRILIGMVAGFTSERWPASGWNARPDNVGIRNFIVGMIEERKDITLNEMVERLEGERSMSIGRSALSDWLRRHG